MDGQQMYFEPSPELKASRISRLFLLWILPLMRRGTRKTLNLEDVYHCFEEDSSAKLGEVMQKKWTDEVNDARRRNQRPRLWKVIARLIWRKYALIGVGFTFDELVLRTIQPIALRNFIMTFGVENPADNPNHRREQFMYAGVLVFVTFCHSLLLQKLVGFVIRLGIQCRLGVSSLLYQKILHLRKSDSEQGNVGKLGNLLALDAGRLDHSFHMFHYFYISPIQLSIYTYLLWKELGAACFGGIGCVLFILSLQSLSGRFFTYFRVRIARRTDRRGRLLNEILTGIRLIKMYAWEKPFAGLISKSRGEEVKFIRRYLYVGGLSASLLSISGKLLPFCTLILYVARGNTLTADKAFFTVSIFYTIIHAILQRIPPGISQLSGLLVSLDRIEEFMLSKNDGDSMSLCNHYTDDLCDSGAVEGNARKGESHKSKQETGGAPQIVMKNYSASWTQEQQTLKNLNVNLRENQLVLVVGHVGSGKSSFLNVILSELPYTSTSMCAELSEESYCRVQGRFSYASQEAWIFPATIRQNILFGLEMEEERYWRAVNLCCLAPDLKQLPEGDLTLVGERGVMLSGGQKARVNLARAMYQQADIYLLDDPLSAVDRKVGKALFEGIRTELEGKLRILVTHQLQYLPMADYIIVLNREGQIWSQGTYEELKSSGTNFTSLFSDADMNGDFDKEADLPCSVSKEENGLRHRFRPRSQNGTPKILKPESDDKAKAAFIGMDIYSRYFKSGDSPLAMALLLISFLAAQLLFNFTDLWLSLWTNAATTPDNDPRHNNVTFGPMVSTSEKRGTLDPGQGQDFYASIYCRLVVTFILISLFRSFLFFWYCMQSSINLHDSMFQGVVRAPVKFFDDNPSGRVMNRFMKDLHQIDELLPGALYDAITALLSILGMLTLNISANYYTAVPSAFLVWALWTLRKFYLGSARDMKRIEALGKDCKPQFPYSVPSNVIPKGNSILCICISAKSPLFTHVTLTAQGLTTIRALGAQHRLIREFHQIQDANTSSLYTFFSMNRWFAVWLDLLTVGYFAFVTLGYIFVTEPGQQGHVGLAISAILSMAGNLQYGVKQTAATENLMTSVERIFEYANLTPEAPLITAEDDGLTGSWPGRGRLQFQDVSLAYDGETRVLRGITFLTEPQEKVGIVGRTGAGKSSLITALFRLRELREGSITIDGVSLNKLGLHTLRSKISIIPQDPVLFKGTLRYNLDPFGEYSKEELWRAIDEVDLQHTVRDLDCPVGEGGNNFSVGQRQLVCLARAVLRQNRVIVLDEATSNVDPRTDSLVQQTIRSKFADCTILTIAHRLHTVLDSDRIMVLEEGTILEFDKPAVLLKNKKGVFYGMFHHQQQQSGEKFRAD